MKAKKTYYSISEVSKMLDIHEHTIRFWNSKLPDLSFRSEKGKTRFFNLKQINTISKINDLLKNNDSLSLALEIVSKNLNKKSKDILNKSNQNIKDSFLNQDKIVKIKKLTNNLKDLILSK